MWKSFIQLLTGPIALLWIYSRVLRDAELAFPQDPPISHGSGPDPDRLLIIGGPIVRGMGVTSYVLALSGHVARQLAARTGRGADIEARGIDNFDTVAAEVALRHEPLERFDALMLILGIRDIVSLRSPEHWRDQIRHLIATIAELVPPTLPVLIVGVAPFAQAMDVPRFVVRWVDRRIEEQNAETKRACMDSGVAEYVPFLPARTGIRHGRDASAVYESWATAMVPTLGRVLTAAHPARSAEPDELVDEGARQHALDKLDIDGGPNAAIDHIVQMARDMLGTDAASINFIDHDRQWSKATSGVGAADIPRADAICNTTIQAPGVYVVEDADREPRFEHAEWRQGDRHIRFYAGYPLEAPGGERVGAICVMDREPRTFTSAETATLRDLALRVQTLLWERAA